MSIDDIIRMARECGNWSGQTVEMNDVGLERFANLVVAAIEQRKPVAWRKHYENSGYTYYDARWKNIPPDAEPLYL